MSDADEVRGYLNQWQEEMRLAVADGSGALADAEGAIAKIDQSLHRFENSRIYALQQLDHLVQLRSTLESILGSGFVNADLINAQGLINRTINMTETYINTLQFQLVELAKRSSILRGKYQQDILEETGNILNKVNQIVEHLAQNL